MSPVPDQVRGKVLGGPLFEWASLVSQGKRIHCKCKSHGLDSWVRKILWRRECNPLQYSCLENPMDRGAWQVTVHGVARVRHDLATKLLLNYGGGNVDDGDLLQKIPCMYCSTQCPQPCSKPPATHVDTPGHSQGSLGQSLVGSFLLGPGTQGSVCALQEYFSSLYKRAYISHLPLKDFTPFSSLLLKTLLSSTEKSAKFRS